MFDLSVLSSLINKKRYLICETESRQQRSKWWPGVGKAGYLLAELPH